MQSLDFSKGFNSIAKFSKLYYFQYWKTLFNKLKKIKFNPSFLPDKEALNNYKFSSQ